MTETTIHHKVRAAEKTLAAAKAERASLQALALLVEELDTSGMRDSETREVLVGIGRDHTARILLHNDSVDALRALLKEDTDEL